MSNQNEDKKPGVNFIRQVIEADLESGKHKKIATRFPPEPNGFLHIGHAKSICLNFGLAQTYSGKCHLRFDDTNPTKEDLKYVNSIQEDVKWLGFDWGENLFFASDYFERLYELACELIKRNKAYVCELNAEQMREYRGDLKKPGKPSPWRERPIDENLDLFKRMRAGEFDDGRYMLRAKIDMSSPNINMRDPVLYRIRKVHHQRTGDQWPIYPMYDYTHCLSDSVEGITHSICTLEFEDHRPLYDWVIDSLDMPCHPQQIEFSRLNLEFTVMSKRRLLQLVEENHVDGWDDPRMPTIAGMKRRGYTPASIRNFCEQIGVTKKDSSITMSTLETCVRDDLGPMTPRALGVLNPIKVVITNYPEGEVEQIEAPYHPQDESFGSRKIPFSKELYIEASDFMEEPPKKYFRLRPGGSVRLRYAYVITCDEVIKDKNGEVSELRCSYHKDTFGGVTPEGMKKVKGIIHWVSATEGTEIEARLYDRLFKVPKPGSDKTKDFKEDINPDSLETVKAYVEPSIGQAKHGERFQFERLGYFIVDQDSSDKKMVFNQTITLRDTWAQIEKAHAQEN
jgi:glutaminyl-tRNA synthetase